MGTIQLLSEETINQIAAGEVIKDPASVVKELVENALDAGATKITIEIADGGLERICVTDNGYGMEKEDALLCLQRHATSKIRTFHDLLHLTTMGFRGEALASIAAISKLTLLTAPSSGIGVKIEVEGGKIASQKPASRAQGTTVEVRELFFNVPARKKFQKSSPALSAAVFRLVTELALSAPSVHMEFFSKGKALCFPACASFVERAEVVLGPLFKEKSLPLDFDQEGLKLCGLIGSPDLAKSNRMGQYLFLNGRSVFSGALNFAIREGYATRIDEKSHPVYLLYLDIAPDLVDVNVHPEKREVRLRDERILTQRVREIVAGAFLPRAVEGKGPIFSFLGQPEQESSFVWEGKCLKEEEPVFTEQWDLRPKEPTILGLLGPYLLLEGSSVDPAFDGLAVVDLRLVQFRLLYDTLLASFEKTLPTKTPSQGLLLPLTIEATPVETAMLLTHLEAFEATGFLIRPAGKQLFLVEAIPPFVSSGEVRSLIEQLATLLQEFIGKAEIAQEKGKKLALATAHFAKKRKSFNVEEARELMRQLATCRDPAYSPQGEKILVHLSDHELQKLFSH
jgi:DNA mismatch repair protein MutL